MFKDPILSALQQQVTTELGEIKAITTKTSDQYFQALVESIVGQQLAVKAATAIRKKVHATVGPDFSPDAVLSIEFEKLRAAGLSNAKANYVRNIATAWQDGTVSVTKLETLSDEELILELTKIKGVGKWTAEMFLIFTLGRPDVFSVGDYGLRKAIIQAYGLDPETKNDQLLELSISWQPHRSMASLILWKSLELPKKT